MTQVKQQGQSGGNTVGNKRVDLVYPGAPGRQHQLHV